jgi:hypothetical protein
MGELVRHLADFRPTGLHGASSSDADSLYGGVATGQKANFDQGLKMGPGFYMTDGSETPEQNAAAHFAQNRVKQVGGRPAVYRVLTRNIDQLRHGSFGGSDWMKKSNVPPKELRPDFRGLGEVITSTLPELGKWGDARAPKELKVAPHMYSDTLEAGIHPNHEALLDKDGLREQLEDKRKGFGIEVMPPKGTFTKSLGGPTTDTRGILGPAYLKALRTRLDKNKG